MKSFFFFWGSGMTQKERLGTVTSPCAFGERKGDRQTLHEARLLSCQVGLLLLGRLK